MNVFGIETISRMTHYSDVTCERGWGKKGRCVKARKITTSEKMVLIAVESCRRTATLCETVDMRNEMSGSAQKRSGVNGGEKCTAIGRLNKIITGTEKIYKAKIARMSGLTFRGAENVLGFLFENGVLCISEKSVEDDPGWYIDYTKLTDTDWKKEAEAQVEDFVIT